MPLDVLASVEETPRAAAREAVSAVPLPEGDGFGSGDFHFERLLNSSGLPEGTLSDLARIFRTLDADGRLKVMETWGDILPKVAAAVAECDKRVEELCASFVRSMREKMDALKAGREAAAAERARLASEVSSGAAAFDDARRSSELAAAAGRIRALAAGPSPETPEPPALPGGDPLAALA